MDGKKIIVGFDAKRAFRNNTGLGNYSRMIISGLAEMHPEVCLVLFTPKREGRYQDFCSSLDNVKVVTPAGMWRFVPSLWRRYGLHRAVRGEGVTLFHGLSHELPRCIGKDVRLVVTMHDLIVWRYPNHFALVDRLIYKRKMRDACRRADAIVAVSRQTGQDLVDYLHVSEKKIHVIYQSCDEIFKQEKIQEECAAVRERYNLPERYVLCVGTIERRKNQKNVVRAMTKIDPCYALVLLGRSTDYAKEVMETVAECGMKDRVHLLSGISFADFPALYKEAEASVYMSIFEGFGIPVLESLYCGTPVLTSNCSSMPEVGGDAALYADPADVDGIAAQLNRLLNDKSLREEFISRAVAVCERFSKKQIVEEMWKLYREL